MIPGRASSEPGETRWVDDRRERRRARGFSRPAWAWLVFLLALAVTLTAAVWQYRRGVAKTRLAEEFAAVSRRPAQPLAAGFAPAVAGKPLWVSARGSIRASRACCSITRPITRPPATMCSRH